MENVENYVYFCLLAVLADRGYRLSNDAAEAKDGILERDVAVMRI